VVHAAARGAGEIILFLGLKNRAIATPTLHIAQQIGARWPGSRQLPSRRDVSRLWILTVRSTGRPHLRHHDSGRGRGVLSVGLGPGRSVK